MNRRSKFRLVARHEYLKHVRRRSFLLATFGLPLLIVAAFGISVVAGSVGQGKASSIGYVDQSGTLALARDDPGFVSFPTLEAAKSDLEATKIHAFYVLAPDYLVSGKVNLYYWDQEPSAKLQARFESFLKANLAALTNPSAAERLVEGPTETIVRSADGRLETSSRGLANIILPFALGLFVTFGLMSSSGYLLRAVSDEKESRTIEIVATSTSPEELIAGKAVGLVGVALTQVMLWALVVIGALAVASTSVEALQGIHLSWGLVLVIAAYFVPLFVLAAGVVIILGVSVADSRQAQQWASLLSFVFLIPLFFSPLLGSSPDGPLMVVLTLFPSTSLLTVAVRWSATVIPLWQLIVAWLILAGCAALSLYAAPRVFRHGMLRYGQRLTLRSAFAALWPQG